MTDGECETEILGWGGGWGGVREMKLEKVIKMERGRLGRDGGGEEDTMQSGTWDEGGWSGGGGGGGLKRQREMMAARRSESLRGPQPHRVRASSCSAVIDRRFVPLRL